jgi:hypothetical protein
MVPFMKRNYASCWRKNRRIEKHETMIILLRYSLVLLVVAGATGCSTLGVKPWQRDVLARPEMQLDVDPLDAAIDDHLYFSKEASSGGRSFAGGGCGCN